MLPSIFLAIFMLQNYYREGIDEYEQKTCTQQQDLFSLRR